jgi:hypothetical protein
VTDIDNDKLNQCVQRFVDLANAMQREKIPQGAISTALMAASGIYATFVAAGNEGGLTESGVDKITAAYREQLEQVQSMKKASSGAPPSSGS